MKLSAVRFKTWLQIECITLTQSIVDDKNVNGLVGRLDKFMSEKSIQTFLQGTLVGLKKYYHMLLGFFSGHLLLVHVGKKLLCQLYLWLIFFDVLVSIATDAKIYQT